MLSLQLSLRPLLHDYLVENLKVFWTLVLYFDQLHIEEFVSLCLDFEEGRTINLHLMLQFSLEILVLKYLNSLILV